ncbi:hypothetical protein BDV19DRAFT_383150 [Aspergillus venezuelensis]
MPDPTALPPELFIQILSSAVQPHPLIDLTWFNFHSGTNLAQLYQLTLVSRQWRGLCLPTLYVKYSHNGARHSYISQWQFLRSVMRNPRIAAIIREMIIAEEEGVRGDNVQFSQGDVEVMRRAIQAEFSAVVLLLMGLLNAETVYLHLPEGCSVLRRVLEEALQYQDEGSKLPCLRHLMHLHLLAEVPMSDPALRLAEIWPCAYFSRLQEIATLLAKKKCQDLPSGETAYCSDRHTVTITRPFPICWDHNLPNGEPASAITVVDIWDALQKHRESLEVLANFYNVHELDEPAPGHFGSLQTFPHLRRFDTQLNILLDGMTADRLAPFRLSDTIPATLDSPSLHPSWVYETSPKFQTTELQAMIAERRRPLKLLALDDILTAPYYNQMKHAERTGGLGTMADAGSEPYPGLWTLCKQAGTQVDVTIRYARGAGPWLWRKSWNIRTDGIQRNRSSVDWLPKPGPRRKTKNYGFPKNGIGAESSKLPPLFPLIVYFTHPSAIPSSDAADLGGHLRAIRDARINSDFHFRLEVYYLSGASENECMTHYLFERASRADYETLIHEFKARVFKMKSQMGSPNHHASPPRMAHSHPGLKPYRGLLLLCAEPNWCHGSQRIYSLRFDKYLVEDSDEYRNSPESITLSLRIAYDRPEYGDDDEGTIGD